MCCFDKGNIEGIYSSKFVSDACVCCFMFFSGMVLWTDEKGFIYD